MVFRTVGTAAVLLFLSIIWAKAGPPKIREDAGFCVAIHTFFAALLVLLWGLGW